MADFLADYSIIADPSNAGGGILWAIDQIFGSVAISQLFGEHWGNPPIVVGCHRVPADKKHVLKTLILNVVPPKYALTLASTDVLGTTSNFTFGPLSIVLNGTTHFEGRLAPNAYHRFPAAYGDEVTAGMQSYAQHFSLHNGISLNASETIVVTLDLLALSAGLVGGWCVTNVQLVGTEAGVPKLLASRTVHSSDSTVEGTPVTLFSYTPSNAFILKSIQVSSVMCVLIGSLAVEYPPGNPIFMLPHMLGVTSSNGGDAVLLGERGIAGYGQGIVAIPLWGITFHETDALYITADPAGDNFVRFQATLTGNEVNECEAGAGGGVGPGVLKSVRSAGPRS